jgi:hypothetical protein
MGYSREHDAMIAQELGWNMPSPENLKDFGYCGYPPDPNYLGQELPCPAYLTAPTAESDYEVLRWVRKHPEAHPTAQGWAGAVASQLWSMWSLRAIEAGASVEPYADVPMYYQAGDYAVALYAVLQEARQ